MASGSGFQGMDLQRENAALRRLADEARAHAEAVDHDAALQHDRAERAEARVARGCERR